MIKDIPFSNIDLNKHKLIDFLNNYDGIIAEELSCDPRSFVQEGDLIRLPTQPNVYAIVNKISYYRFSINKKYIIQYKILAEIELNIYKP